VTATLLDLSGRTVLVTGGTRGIGHAIATAFLDAGATVVVCARSEAEQLPRGRAGSASLVLADVRDPAQAADAADAALAVTGQLDIVVNNAGGARAAPAATMPPRLAAAIVELNLLAPFYLAQCANAIMQTQAEGGAIINVGSVAAFRPAPGTAIYAAAKAGLSGLTRALAVEWGPKVRVNQVTPGPVDTPGASPHYGGQAGVDAVGTTIPAGRMARPEDVAAACLLLASPSAVYLTGAELRVDGGGERPAWVVALEHLDEPEPT
jgi:NAD(P)-dependent dehydrogenase (short-subunit alcohol dehydrogenase family)